jgi:hypothetical protein
MSDVSQGHGWWLAVDGKWYPPVAPALTPAGPPFTERPDLFPLEVPELVFAEAGSLSFDWNAEGFHIRDRRRGVRAKALHTFALTEDGWEQAWRLMLGTYRELADAVMAQAAMESDEEDAQLHADFVGEWQIMLFTPEGEAELRVKGGPLDAADAARRAVEGASGSQVTKTDFGWQSLEGNYAAITRPIELSESSIREEAPPTPAQIDNGPAKLSPAWALLVAGAVLALGSLLPWATANIGLTSVSISGTSGDGLITLLAGLAIMLVGGALVLDAIRPTWAWLAVPAGIIALFVAGYDLHHLPRPNATSIRIQAGIGLWLCLIGALGSLLLAVVTLTQERRASV